MIAAMVHRVLDGITTRIAAAVEDALTRPLPANLLDPEAPDWAYGQDD